MSMGLGCVVAAQSAKLRWCGADQLEEIHQVVLVLLEESKKRRIFVFGADVSEISSNLAGFPMRLLS